MPVSLRTPPGRPRSGRGSGAGTAASAPAAGSVSTCAGGPDSSTTPPSMNSTWSATCWANRISWVTTTIVQPSAARSLITCSTSPTSSGSSAEVGSSNSISLGRSASARAIPTRCCWPPESWYGYWSAFSPARPAPAGASASSRASAFGRRCTMTGPSMTFCSTVMCGNRLWPGTPCRSARGSGSGWLGPGRRRSRPTRRRCVMTPASAWSSALSVRSTVVLPEPDGPITAVTVPAGTSNEMPLSTSRSPNALRTSRTVEQIRFVAVIGHVPFQSRLQPALDERQDHADHPVVQGRHPVEREEVERRRGRELGHPQQLGDQDRRGQRGVLDQRDQRVRQRRHGGARRLRQDDPPQRGRVAHADRLRRLPLAPWGCSGSPRGSPRPRNRRRSG